MAAGPVGPRWLFPVLVGLLGEVKAVMPKVQPTRNPPPPNTAGRHVFWPQPWSSASAQDGERLALPVTPGQAPPALPSVWNAGPGWLRSKESWWQTLKWPSGVGLLVQLFLPGTRTLRPEGSPARPSQVSVALGTTPCLTLVAPQLWLSASDSLTEQLR